MMRMGILAAGVAAIAMTAMPMAAGAQARPDQKQFFDLYKQLVETNTVVDVGSCTQAAAQIGARLKAAGYGDADLTLFSVPDHPKDGGIVAILKGSDARIKPMLLLGHLDVVAAKREDWTRDPFTLIEENGYYYARGTVDDKAMAAVWADTMIRLKQAKTPPKRTIKMALTCGEETTFAFNGAEWLAKNKPDLIAAEFVLNEGGGGRLDANGKRELLAVQVGEKAAQNYTFLATNPGGHSSQPTPENAIYELADAVKAVQGYEFPIHLTDTTRAFLTATAQKVGGQLGDSITRLLANPEDKAADAIVSQDKALHSTLRTTCVATLLQAGHAENALPQRATANINCRIFPGHKPADIMAELGRVIDDPGVKLEDVSEGSVPNDASPMRPDFIAAIDRAMGKVYPGVPVFPAMASGASDSMWFRYHHVPSYGASPTFIKPSEDFSHGLNERTPISTIEPGIRYYRLLFADLSK